MEPIEFKNMNAEIAKNQPEYGTLPSHVDEEGIVTSCWKLTIKERIKLIFTGRIYVQILTFGSRLQPQNLSIQNPLLIIEP